MFTKTKIAICVATVVCAASAGFAKDQSSGRNGVEFGADSRCLHSFSRAQIVQSHPRRHGTATVSTALKRQPTSNPEWWQNRDNTENTGPDR